jgi:hypothetical protein
LNHLDAAFDVGLILVGVSIKDAGSRAFMISMISRIMVELVAIDHDEPILADF